MDEYVSGLDHIEIPDVHPAVEYAVVGAALASAAYASYKLGTWLWDKVSSDN